MAHLASPKCEQLVRTVLNLRYMCLPVEFRRDILNFSLNVSGVSVPQLGGSITLPGRDSVILS